MTTLNAAVLIVVTVLARLTAWQLHTADAAAVWVLLIVVCVGWLLIVEDHEENS